MAVWSEYIVVNHPFEYILNVLKRMQINGL